MVFVRDTTRRLVFPDGVFIADPDASSSGGPVVPSGYPSPPPPSQPSPPEYQDPPPPPPQPPLPPPELEPGEENDDLSPEFVKAMGEAMINSRSEPDVEDNASTPDSMPDLASSSEEADYNGADSDNSGPVHDAMDDDSTAPTVNDIHDRMTDFRRQGPPGQDRHGGIDYQVFHTHLSWHRHRAWDTMSMTPGRQPPAVQDLWRTREEREALTWLGNLARISESDLPNNTEIRTEFAQAARQIAVRHLEAHRVDRGPESFHASEFTWTFRCTDGCGWAEVSEDDIELCPRCLETSRTKQPKKYPTFLNEVCAESYDSRPSDWFYFCHMCQKCTWHSRCCSANTRCVDVRALKRLH